jgi:hypothetical protein
VPEFIRSAFLFIFIDVDTCPSSPAKSVLLEMAQTSRAMAEQAERDGS